MTENLFDEEYGLYPSEDALAEIREWDYRDVEGLMSYVFALWHSADRTWKEKIETVQKFGPANTYKVYELNTLGWSGNERIIKALRSNTLFWNTHWFCSMRGGYYEFRIILEK